MLLNLVHSFFGESITFGGDFIMQLVMFVLILCLCIRLGSLFIRIGR